MNALHAQLLTLPIIALGAMALAFLLGRTAPGRRPRTYLSLRKGATIATRSPDVPGLERPLATPCGQALDPETCLTLERGLAAAVGVVYVIAFFLPALRLDNYGDRVTGVHCFLLGLGGGLTILPWSANPLLLVGFVLLVCRRPAAARTCGVLALVVAAATYPVLLRWGQAPRLLVGYYFWAGSMALLTLYGALLAAAEGTTPPAKETLLVLPTPEARQAGMGASADEASPGGIKEEQAAEQTVATPR